MLRNILASILLIFSFLILYYLNFYNKFNYYYYASSILENSENKLKNIELVISKIGASSSKLMQEKNNFKNKFISKLLVYQKNIIKNDYNTLQALFLKFINQHLAGDYKALKANIVKTRTVIRNSSLESGAKIRLFNEVRAFSLALNDYINADNTFTKYLKEAELDLGSAIDVFSKDTLNKFALEKIKDFEETRYLLNVIAYIALFFGLLLFLLEYFTIKKRIKYEVKALSDACDSIRNGSEPEILIKLKRMHYFTKIKHTLFETIKFLNNKIDYFKDLLNDIKIPLKYTDDEGVTISNSEYNNLEIKDEDFMLVNNNFYEKRNNSYCEYYSHIDKNKAKVIIEKELINNMAKDECSKLSDEAISYLNRVKEEKLLKKKYISKHKKALFRLNKAIKLYRQLKNDHKRIKSVIDSNVNESSNYLTKTLKISEDINLFGNSIAHLRNDYDNELRLTQNLDVLKDFFSDNINKIGIVYSELETYQKTLDVLYKDLQVQDIDMYEAIVLKNKGSNISKELENIRHTFYKFEALLKNIKLIDEEKIKDLESLYKNLFSEVDDLNISLEKNSLFEL